MGKYAQPMSISKALLEIASNNYLLPSFQRDFKWESEDVELLFDSIMQGFPINSMLFWKTDSSIIKSIKFYFFNDEFIENPERVTNSPCQQKQCKQVKNKDFFAILDGQQRLTALRIGLYGKYYSHIKNKEWDYRKNSFEEQSLYFNLTKFGKGNEDVKYIFKFYNTVFDNKRRTVPIFRDENKEAWYLLNDLQYLHDEKNNGKDTGDYYKDYNLNDGEKKMINLLHNKIYTEDLINYYEENTPSIDTAVKIFTRINNGGKTLPLEEIIYSIIKSNWTQYDARKEIEDLITNVKNIGFNIGLAYIIKSFLVLYSSDVKYQLKTFDISFCKLLEQNWSDIKNSIIEIFNTLKNYGMSSDNLTAPNATIIMLYYIFHKNLKQFSTAKKYSTDRNNMKNWLYSVLLRKVFGGHGDNVLTQARNAFQPDFVNKKYINSNTYFDKNIINKSINKITQQSTDTVVEELLKTQKDNSLAFLILSLLFPYLDYQNGDFHKDHMHPFTSCEKLALNKDEYNSIVNLQLLNSNENQSKNKKELKDWVDSQTKGKPKNWISDFYDSHIIPLKIDLDLSKTKFEKFYDVRKDALKTKLQNLL